MWPSFITGLLTLQLEWIFWGKAQQPFLPASSTAEGTACVWESRSSVALPTHIQMMAASSPALQPSAFTNRAHESETSLGKIPSVQWLLKEKKKKGVDCASLSKQWSIALFCSPFKHSIFWAKFSFRTLFALRNIPIFTMLDDAILLTYLLVCKQ